MPLFPNVQFSKMQIDDASKMIKHSKLWGWKDCFSNVFFPLSNAHPFIIGMIIILIVKKGKEVEIGRIHFYNTFVHLWFQGAFGFHENY
jgi:hypothetical protein